MRTIEQISTIKKTMGDPKQLCNMLNAHDINLLLNHYITSNAVITKNTGPKVLMVNEGDGIIDNILITLRLLYGNFALRSAHYFDVTKPHIIHNDDDFDYPQCYKAFVIPLYVEEEDCNKAKFFVFDQSYYGGPAKFLNDEDITSTPIYYNKLVTNYNDVEDKVAYPIDDDTYSQYLTHLRPKWLEGLSINSYFPWTIGSVIAFDSLKLHCASDFRKVGITRKIGLSIFTKIKL